MCCMCEAATATSMPAEVTNSGSLLLPRVIAMVRLSASTGSANGRPVFVLGDADDSDARAERLEQVRAESFSMGRELHIAVDDDELEWVGHGGEHAQQRRKLAPVELTRADVRVTNSLRGRSLDQASNTRQPAMASVSVCSTSTHASAPTTPARRASRQSCFISRKPRCPNAASDR